MKKEKNIESTSLNIKLDNKNSSDDIVSSKSELNNKSINSTTGENSNNQENNKDEKKKKKLGKYFIYCCIILVLTAISLYFSLAGSFNDVVAAFNNLDYINLLYACLCMIGVIVLNGLIMTLFARRYKKRYFILQGTANYMIGFFYNQITPAQTGGQIMQAYTYKKQGIQISNATSCLVMNFIVYQTALIAIAIFSVIYKSNEIFGTPAFVITINDFEIPFPIIVLVILGFIVEFLSIGIIVLMSYWKGFHSFILNHGVNLFHKLKIVKDVDQTRMKLNVQVDSFKIELKNLFANPAFLILVFMLNFAALAVSYMIPHFLNIAVLGNDVSAYTYNILDSMCLTSFHKLVTELIPIPGGAGISEYFYYQIFFGGYSSDFSDLNRVALTNTAQILWRTITFHIPLIISGIIAAFYRGRPSKEEIDSVESKAVTYLTLQMQTIDERKLTYNTLYQTNFLDKVKKKIKKKNSKQSHDELNLDDLKSEESIKEDIESSEKLDKNNSKVLDKPKRKRSSKKKEVDKNEHSSI